MAYRLGIDLGTTNLVAAISVDGAPAQLVGLGTHAPQTRSVLYLGEDGRFLVGDAAAAHETDDPSRLIIDPRRQLGTDKTLVVGGEEVTPEQATAAALSFVRDRAIAQQGGPPAETVLTHPAHWSEYQLECFDRAIAAADLGRVRRSTEAEAAAATYAVRNAWPEGARVAVYDLGGGSCEVTVLERTPTGPRPLGGGEGAEHPSGADFDEAVLRLVLGGLGDRGRDLKSDNAEARARLAEVRRQCTAAKETLSTAAEAAVTVSLPGYTTTVRLSRREFESLIRPALRDSITMTARVLRGADQPANELAAIVLVGGSHADADRRRPAAARVRGADRAGHPPGVRRGRRCGADRAARCRLRIGRRRPTGRGRRRCGSGPVAAAAAPAVVAAPWSQPQRRATMLRPRPSLPAADTSPAAARTRGATAARSRRVRSARRWRTGP